MFCTASENTIVSKQVMDKLVWQLLYSEQEEEFTILEHWID